MKLDPEQAKVAARLARLAGELPMGWSVLQTPPRGIYLVGAVGRGKTMLMDAFFDGVKKTPKRRAHFHAFMRDVHARLHEGRKQSKDAIALVAKSLAAQARLLCLDELLINDIADAMIVGRLFDVLLARGVVIVTTSNLAPDDLYTDGLNRKLFLPFIEMIKDNLDVIELPGLRDYRLGRVAARDSYASPLGARAEAAVQEAWRRLTDTERGEPRELNVLGRKLRIPQAAHGCARFDFADICGMPLGPPDYLALSQNFGTIFVENIPVLSAERQNESARAMVLVDALYDAGTRLVVSAAAPPDGLGLPERTASRLKEMQSESWWSKKIIKS